MNRNISTLMSVAAGVGLLAGTTGALLYHYFLGRRYVVILEQDLDQLHVSLANLKCEFNEMKGSRQRNDRPRRNKRSYKRNEFNDTDGNTTDFTDASMYSALETDLDDEFCDLSDSEATNTSQSCLSYVTAMSGESEAAENETRTSDEFSKIDSFLDVGSDEDKTRTKEILLKLYKDRPEDCEVLWRLARVSHSLAGIEGAKGDAKKKQQLLNEGVEYGRKAIEIDANSSNAHKWYGICVGAYGQTLGMKEKIKNGVTFKEQIEIALKLDNSDPIMYNLLGRFEFEVSQLSSMERRVAGWLFAEVPQGTVENAIALFEKTEELKPHPWKENRLWLAKCYIQAKKYDIAFKWLDKALEVPAINSEERGFDEEVGKLMKKYESYRT